MARRLNSGVVQLLSSWPWQAFVSLTWPARIPSTGIQERIYFSWVRKVGLSSGVCKGSAGSGVRFLWARRDELGEKTGRPHLHALVGGLPDWFIGTFVLVPRPAIGSWWESFGGGNVRTSPVVGCSEVVSYFTKPGSEIGGREYELGKFGSSAVMLSKHAEARLTALAKERCYTSAPEIQAHTTIPAVTGLRGD